MKIIKVTPENVGTFNKNLKTPNVIAFVKIYSDQCGHCKDLEPKWNKLEDEMKNESMEGLLASLSVNDLDNADCDTETKGVPTLRVYEGGKRIMDYEGRRETNDMKLFFKNLLKKQKGGKRKTKKRRKNKTKKRRKNKTRKRRKNKTRKIKGGLSKLGQLKIDAILANALKGTKKDSEFSDDAIRLLQEIHSTSDNEDEEEELDMDLLKLTGGRKSRRRNKSRKRKSKRRKYKRKKSKRKRTRKR